MAHTFALKLLFLKAGMTFIDQNIDRYFINTPAVMGQNLQLNNVATSFPGSIHDSKVHYIIDQTTMKYC